MRFLAVVFQCEFCYLVPTRRVTTIKLSRDSAWMLESSHRDVFECVPSLASGLRRILAKLSLPHNYTRTALK
jgi:hypothetical protein